MRLPPMAALTAILCHAQSSADLLRQAEEHLQGERFAQAEVLLSRALQQDASSIEALYRLGYAQYRQRKLLGARRAFTAVVKTAPPAHYSRYFLGRIALTENKPEEAVTWLEPVAASNEAVFDTHAQLAGAYAAAGQPAKAMSPLKTAIAAAPWDGALYYRLSQLHQRLGQNELAREALQNATRLNNASRGDVETIMRVSQALAAGGSPDASAILGRPDADPNSLVALGVVFGNAGRHAEALDAFDRAAARDAGIFQAQFNYGLALMKAGRASDALAPLTRAVELLPQSQEANTTLGLAAVMNRRYADAVVPLERAWRMDSTNARVGALLATAYVRTGAARKAVPVLRDLERRGGDDPAPLLLLVEALNAAEDQTGALDAAQSARKRFPQLAQVHMAAAQQLARLGRYQDARPAFEQALLLAPGHPEATLGLADTLQKAGDHTAALEHYRAASGGERTALAARLGLARSLVALRRLAEARAALEQGLSAFPSDVTLRLELSRVYARLGESALAAEQARAVEQLRTEQARQ